MSRIKANIASLLLKCLAPMAWSFEARTKDPIRAQNKTLFTYLARNKNTEIGKKYGFSSIKSVEEYRARVPISDYESMRPLVDRMAGGENVGG